MNVLILGANGLLGPHVVKALQGKHNLKATDIRPPPPEFSYDWTRLDATDLDWVVAAAEGMDAIINLAVLRHDPGLAFNVNTRGTYNMMVAAVTHGIRRVINTGPQSVVAGAYERFDHEINPDVPPHTDTRVYGLSKALGHEITRIFTENHDIYVTMFLYSHFRGTAPRHDDPPFWKPFTVGWDDAAALFRLGLEIPLHKLPSKFETYFVSADIPNRQYSNEKAKRVFGWQPTLTFDQFWKRQSK